MKDFFLIRRKTVILLEQCKHLPNLFGKLVFTKAETQYVHPVFAPISKEQLKQEYCKCHCVRDFFILRFSIFLLLFLNFIRDKYNYNNCAILRQLKSVYFR